MTRFPTDRLAREWPALATRALAPRLRTWAEEEPRLTAFESPQALLGFLRSRNADSPSCSRALAPTRSPLASCSRRSCPG